MKKQDTTKLSESKGEEEMSVQWHSLSGHTPRQMAALKAYYNRMKKGMSPEQARQDLDLSLEEINAFDFSIFKEDNEEGSKD